MSPGHDNPTLWSNANHTDDYSPNKVGALPTFNRFVTSGNYSTQVKNTQYTAHPMTPTYNQVSNYNHDKMYQMLINLTIIE